MEASQEAPVSPKDTTSLSQTPKSRSFSDPPNALSTLAPSPTFRDRLSGSKDDHSIPNTPKSLRRPELFSRGLSLHLPHRDTSSMPAPAAPLSPELDKHNIYFQSEAQAQSALQKEFQQHSPATSLPRHSRGLDLSRACTNLHHSTLAERRRSPDTSPTLTQKGMMIPPRKSSVSSMMLDSPNLGPGNAWGPLAPERSAVSSSVGSITMLGSESESDSDGDASMGGYDGDDAMFTTPQVHKLQNPNTTATPFAAQIAASPTTANHGGWGAGGNFSPAAASLMKNIRRTRLQKNGKRNRKGSSSASNSNSGYSSHASPRNTSPPPLRSIESSTTAGPLPWSKAARSRRESLAMGTDGLNLSSGNDSGDEATAPSTPGVVRRVVTRRGNLLPKTKGFARIRAALAEEATPQDTDVRREAETIRQVRERDNSVSDFDLERSQTATAGSSPNLLPAVPESAQENFEQELDNEPSLNNQNKGQGLLNFSAQASRNSGGMDYWNRFDPSSMRTPPPPSFPRHSSSAMSDVNMDSPAPSENKNTFPINRRFRAASTASEAESVTTNNPSVPAAASDDVHLNKFKRRREDDFDIATIKRRAVSPGMSSQNSPVLTQSPSQRDSINGWGAPPERKRDGQAITGDALRLNMQNMPDLQPVRSGSNGSNISMASGSTMQTAPGGKKLGLQGMVDTNDGLMKMSIE